MREVLAKVALGEVDAGFVYSTDAKTVPGQVKVIKVPAWAQPKVQYGMCVVSRAARRPRRRRSSSAVLSKAGQAKLHKFGFLPRVKPKTPQAEEEVAAQAPARLGFGLFVAVAVVDARLPRRCRSSRSSPTPRRPGSSISSRTPSSPTRSSSASRRAWSRRPRSSSSARRPRICSPRAASRGTRSRSRSSSCRSCCRRRSPGIGLLAALGRFGLLGSTPAHVRDRASVHQAAVTRRRRLRRQPALHPPGDRRVRSDRPEPDRRVAHPRRRPGPHVLPRRPAARARRPRSPGSRSRSPAGSASSARRSCSPAACRSVTQTLPLAIYCGVRRELQRDAGDERRARHHQRRPAR